MSRPATDVSPQIAEIARHIASFEGPGTERALEAHLARTPKYNTAEGGYAPAGMIAPDNIALLLDIARSCLDVANQSLDVGAKIAAILAFLGPYVDRKVDKTAPEVRAMIEQGLRKAEEISGGTTKEAE